MSQTIHTNVQTDAPVGARLSPKDRHRHLLQVARSIVEVDGSSALTMDAVAERAGVSRGLVYVYFESRAALLLALWNEVAAAWDGEPMPSVDDIPESDLRTVFENRLIANTRWYFDQIERGGLVFYRLMSEPILEPSVESLRKRIHDDNVWWWARLIERLGVEQQRSLVVSTIFNGASEMLWELIARKQVDRKDIEEVFFASVWATLERLLDD